MTLTAGEAVDYQTSVYSGYHLFERLVAGENFEVIAAVERAREPGLVRSVLRKNESLENAVNNDVHVLGRVAVGGKTLTDYRSASSGTLLRFSFSLATFVFSASFQGDVPSISTPDDAKFSSAVCKSSLKQSGK